MTIEAFEADRGVSGPAVVSARRGHGHLRKPGWLRVRAPGGPEYARLKRILGERGLHTVCEEARCPNVGECWGSGTATFMALGDVCTRGCRFCAVTSGSPGGRVDAEEPRRVAEAVAAMGLDYVVLTMVDRDDLADGGAEHVARCIDEIKSLAADVLVEALIGDFRGDSTAIDRVCDAGPDVLAHNIETVRRLQDTVRDRRCGYELSLSVLQRAKSHRLAPLTKSSIMLGLGERDDELACAMRDLRARGVDFLTLGQYLRPTQSHLPVREYVAPERFDALRQLGESAGFLSVAAGPLVRSSYRAGELFVRSLLRPESQPAGRRGRSEAETGPPAAGSAVADRG